MDTNTPTAPDVLSPELAAKWAAIPRAVQDKLLDKHRDINVWDDWWESTYEALQERCEAIGIEVDLEKTHFSGFWSQGDGAAITGRVHDWTKFLVATGHADLVRFIEDCNGLTLTCRAGSSNNQSVNLDCDMSNPYGDEDDQHLQWAAWNIATKDGAVFYDLEEEFTKFFDDLASQLYEDLEAEHEHLTSDAEVITFILEHCEGEIAECEEK